ELPHICNVSRNLSRYFTELALGCVIGDPDLIFRKFVGRSNANLPPPGLGIDDRKPTGCLLNHLEPTLHFNNDLAWRQTSPSISRIKISRTRRGVPLDVDAWRQVRREYAA